MSESEIKNEFAGLFGEARIALGLFEVIGRRYLFSSGGDVLAGHIVSVGTMDSCLCLYPGYVRLAGKQVRCFVRTDEGWVAYISNPHLSHRFLSGTFFLLE